MIAVPVYNTIVLPGSSFTFQGSFFKELSGVDEAAAGDKVMFLFLKEEKPRADVRPEDIRPIGVSAHVESISDDGNVTVKCEERVTLESIEIDEEGNISVSAAVSLSLQSLMSCWACFSLADRSSMSSSPASSFVTISSNCCNASSYFIFFNLTILPFFILRYFTTDTTVPFLSLVSISSPGWSWLGERRMCPLCRVML